MTVVHAWDQNCHGYFFFFALLFTLTLQYQPYYIQLECMCQPLPLITYNESALFGVMVLAIILSWYGYTIIVLHVAYTIVPEIAREIL